VRTGAPVEKLLVRGGSVTGVRLVGGEELTAKAVLTSCNPKTTLTRLLPEGVLSEPLAKRAAHIPIDVTKGITIKVNAAFSGRLTLPRHQAKRDDGVDLRTPLSIWHTLEEYENAWDACLAGELPDPIPYLCAVPSSFDPSQAPAGQDTFWGWSGVTPAHPNEPWEKMADRAARSMLKDAAQHYSGIDEFEIGYQVLTGPRIEERFWAQDGNIFHVDPVLLRHGPLRPAQGFGGYRTPVPGLYLSGAGTHPTAGICGIPGQLAAKEVLKRVAAG
jgi:phytoene dehydrogenase-like protein